MTIVKRGHCIRGLLTISLIVPLALLSACDKSDSTADGPAHAPGADHATSSRAVATVATDAHAGHNAEQTADGHSHGAPPGTIRLSASTAQPVRAGEKLDVTIKLTKRDGSPVTLDDLKEAHTEKIHVLINDSTLTDYHHEHPVAGAVPGEFRFSFTPQKNGAYRMWADVVPLATDTQEYVMADLGGAVSAAEVPNRAATLTTSVEGLTYAVTFEGPLKAGAATMGKLTVKDASGAVFPALEPIMGAYAHIVGFSEDLKTIAHIHPMGEEPKTPSDRGAGELDFHIQPEKAGLVRLFAQVQIGGQSKFAPFTLNVEP